MVMAQAKTLSEKELKRLLAAASQTRHAERDRAMVMMSFMAGMRVGEIAALKIGDVLNTDGSIKDQITRMSQRLEAVERIVVPDQATPQPKQRKKR